MPGELSVHVNRGGAYAIDAPDSFEAADPFVVHVRNHGEGLHVHLRLDGALSEAGVLDATNHHVEADSERYIHVDLNPEAADGRGALEIVTGYGTERARVPVAVTDAQTASECVQVGESLGEPPSRDEGPGAGTWLTALVAVLGVFALALAVIAVQTVDATPVALGALVVVAGVGLAVAVLVR